MLRGQAEKRIAGFVHEILSPLHKTGQLSREGYSWVAKKTVHKVMERRQDKDSSTRTHDPLSAARQDKIRALVHK